MTGNSIEKAKMTIIVVAFRDDADRAVIYKKFDGANAVDKAAKCYRALLEMATFETKKKKPRVISTRIIVDE